MVGTGSHSGRNHSGDRFYNHPAARRQMQMSQQQQQQVQINHRSSAVAKTKTVSGNKEPENRTNSGESSKTTPTTTTATVTTTTTAIFSSPRPPSGNLDRFLESTTPFVPAQHFFKMSFRDWRTRDVEFHPFFTLGDLWDSFKEWSAYGAGVPLVLNGSDSVVQYYVPYLSGIQVYADSTKHTLLSSRPGEESDGEYRDTSSEGSSDSEMNRGSKHIGDAMNWNSEFKFDRLSLREKPPLCQMAFSSDDGEPSDSKGPLIFEYLEQAPPYSREPLADKISDLSRQFPGLKTLKSCDLLPTSWISVAWYPIYRIPTGPTLRDLEACFLTFHSLSTPLRGTSDQSQAKKLSLPVFGLASYKFKGSVWTPTGVCEQQLASTLLHAAEMWLSLLQVNHPDFRFFLSHNTHWR